MTFTKDNLNMYKVLQLKHIQFTIQYWRVTNWKRWYNLLPPKWNLSTTDTELPQLSRRNETITPAKPSPLLQTLNQTITLKATTTLRTLIKIINLKLSRSNPYRKLEIIALSPDLNNIKPQKKDFNTDTREIGELVLVNVAADFGLIPELIGSYEREAAGAVEVGGELAGGGVEIVVGDADWEDADWEIVWSDCFVRRGVGGEDGGDEEEGGEYSYGGFVDWHGFWWLWLWGIFLSFLFGKKKWGL